MSKERVIVIAKDFIKKWEGLSLTRYKCSASIATIGYGHVIRKNEQIKTRISESKADALLEEDLDKAYNVLNRYCNHLYLNDYNQAALLSFIFNCGSGAFQSSTLRQKLQRGEYGLAADEFLRWVYVGGKKVRGLVNRRYAERELFMTDSKIVDDNVSGQNFAEKIALFLSKFKLRFI